MDQELQRLELHSLLETFADNVYYQAPSNQQMQYPCIRYQLDAQNVKFADNQPYRRKWRYQVTVIDLDPSSPIKDKVADLPLCTFNRFYPADSLNHFVFDLFF